VNQSTHEKFQWLQDKLLNDEKRNINLLNHVLRNFKDAKTNNLYFVMVISGEKNVLRTEEDGGGRRTDNYLHLEL